MKKTLFAMVACAMFCACASDGLTDIAGSLGNGGGGSAVYLTVSVRDAGSSTRADDKGYAYGTADEQRIATGTDGSAGTTDNIEFKSNTVVAVWGIEDTSVPKYMVTVLNQPDDFEYGSTLATMAEALANGDCGWQDGNGNFVMSTSSYVGYNETRPAYFVTEINEGDFRSEPVSLESDYAGDDAVQVYVERLAAKVQVDVALQNDGVVESEKNGYLIPAAPLGVSSVIAKEGELTDSLLYIALNGWGLTGTARNSNAVKDITGLNVTSGIDGWTGWNDPGNFRSYWGKSYNYGKTDGGPKKLAYPTSPVRSSSLDTGDKVAYRGNTDADESGEDESLWLNKYLKYSSLSDALPFGDEACAYCSENTNTPEVLEKKTSSAITNVVLKAQLGAYDEDEDKFTPTGLVMYNGQYYTVDAFKDYIAEKFMNAVTEDYAIDIFGSNLWNTLLSYGTQLGSLNNNLWVKKSDSTADYEAFDGRFVKLTDHHSVGEGCVGVRFEIPAAVRRDGMYPDGQYSSTYELEGEPVSPADESLGDYEIYLRWDGWVEYSSMLSWILKLFSVEATVVDDPDMSGNSKQYLYIRLGESAFSGTLYDDRNYILSEIEKDVHDMNERFVDTEKSPMNPQLYQDGLMYYNAPIEHLNNEAGAMLEAQYGVVRNHWYKVTVEDVSQLGTPIANEESVIVPQDKDLQYLGASVNVLSWKVVEQSMSFTNQ